MLYGSRTRETEDLSSLRVDTPNTHGTGCTLASTLAASRQSPEGSVTCTLVSLTASYEPGYQASGGRRPQGQAVHRCYDCAIPVSTQCVSFTAARDAAAAVAALTTETKAI